MVDVSERDGKEKERERSMPSATGSGMPRSPPTTTVRRKERGLESLGSSPGVAAHLSTECGFTRGPSVSSSVKWGS